MFFGGLVHKWYSTDVVVLKTFVDRAHSIYNLALAGGKNTYYSSWLKSTHLGYKPNDSLGFKRFAISVFNFSATQYTPNISFIPSSFFHKHESMA